MRGTLGTQDGRDNLRMNFLTARSNKRIRAKRKCTPEKQLSVIRGQIRPEFVAGETWAPTLAKLGWGTPAKVKGVN